MRSIPMADFVGTDASETVNGTIFPNNTDDNLFGLNGDDTLNAFGGNDLLKGGGADVLNGGSGNDTADYGDSASGVTVLLDTGNASGGTAQGDTLNSIENVNGSGSDDLLRGTAGVNVLSGAGGDDILKGGGGADQLIGGGGSDTASYVDSVAGVTVNLGANTGTDGDAAGDTFSGVENVTGSPQADTL